eukprot:CAMPEP_0185263156 /NCGR_PEP_ID=MMETSP1359-20130426/12156_1 /TAXON_ID=552665 /ORGANISM="Bigelowiella longifila, Strain CCMP242" /LENGTH=107 /DNA_ID=CAMNT_0027850341 /DNA_START=122 /DNA_END=442 /DNA_ORIENTATION=-
MDLYSRHTAVCAPPTSSSYATWKPMHPPPDSQFFLHSLYIFSAVMLPNDAKPLAPPISSPMQTSPTLVNTAAGAVMFASNMLCWGLCSRAIELNESVEMRRRAAEIM